jgi:hypothetical protein
MKFLAALAGTTFATAGALLVLSKPGDAQQQPVVLPRGNFTHEAARTVRDFPVYDAGPKAEGVPMTAVVRRNDTANFLSFIYGGCVATSDRPCAAPAEVQNWPVCVRNLGLYDPTIPGTPVPDRTTVRGVPAAFFDDGERLEIHTGRALVVVFTASREASLRLASALRGVNVPTSPNEDLPPPVAGAVEGRILC